MAREEAVSLKLDEGCWDECATEYPRNSILVPFLVTA